MIISLLVAMDENRGIGFENRLPWHISSDLRRFKSLTMGHYLVMGRKTYESIGRILPGRSMIILTRESSYQADGCVILHSLKDAVRFAEAAGEQELFVIGGGEVFSQAMTIAERLYLTIVHERVQADVYFPVIDENDWQELESNYLPASEKDQFATTFRVLEIKRTTNT
jgi:dihydrofolate reductase